MKFRKKPVVIEARHLGHIGSSDCDGCVLERWIGNGANCDGLNLYIPTLEGTMKGEPGDWIIRGIKGEFYPCKPDIFTATYDAVDES